MNEMRYSKRSSVDSPAQDSKHEPRRPERVVPPQPLQQPEKPTREQPLVRELGIDPKQLGLLERLRKMTLPKIVMIGSALGGIFPAFENAFEKQQPQTEQEAEDFLLNGIDANDFDIIKQHDGSILVREKGFDDPGHPHYSAEKVHIRIPGAVETSSIEVPMDWAGRNYEKDPNATYGEQELYDFADAKVAQNLEIYRNIGVNVNDAVESVVIYSVGAASPEGYRVPNQEASEGRSVKAGIAFFDAYAKQGIAADKIDLYTQGIGAIGSVQDFITHAEDSGVRFHAHSAKSKMQEAIAMIRRCNDGTEKNPQLIEAFEAEIVPNRRADVEVIIAHPDIVLEMRDDDANPLLYPPVAAPDWNIPTQPGVPIKQPPTPYTPPIDNSPRHIPVKVLKGRDVPSAPARAVGTSSYTSVPRAAHSKGQHNANTGRRQYQSPQKRSAPTPKGGRNGSR